MSSPSSSSEVSCSTPASSPIFPLSSIDHLLATLDIAKRRCGGVQNRGATVGLIVWVHRLGHHHDLEREGLAGRELARIRDGGAEAEPVAQYQGNEHLMIS